MDCGICGGSTLGSEIGPASLLPSAEGTAVVFNLFLTSYSWVTSGCETLCLVELEGGPLEFGFSRLSLILAFSWLYSLLPFVTSSPPVLD